MKVFLDASVSSDSSDAVGRFLVGKPWVRFLCRGGLRHHAGRRQALPCRDEWNAGNEPGVRDPDQRGDSRSSSQMIIPMRRRRVVGRAQCRQFWSPRIVGKSAPPRPTESSTLHWPVDRSGRSRTRSAGCSGTWASRTGLESELHRPTVGRVPKMESPGLRSAP